MASCTHTPSTALASARSGTAALEPRASRPESSRQRCRSSPTRGRIAGEHLWVTCGSLAGSSLARCKAFLKIQAICVTDEYLGKTYGLGDRTMGNLEKLPEATGIGVTKLLVSWRFRARGGVSGSVNPMTAEVGRECTRGASDVEKTTVGCPDGPGMGLGWPTHPAQAASYAGGASLRICPVPQECGGHVQYQLQRQTVLRNVQETVYETQQVPCVRTVCETVMQPRTITDDAECGRAARPRRGVHGQAARVSHGDREVHYTVQRPVTRTDLEGRGVHGLPAGARDALTRPSPTRSTVRSARRRSRPASTTSAARSARPRSRT